MFIIYKDSVRNMFNSKGRDTRKQFWTVVILTLILNAILIGVNMTIDKLIGYPENIVTVVMIFNMLFYFFTLIVMFMCGTRRINDALINPKYMMMVYKILLLITALILFGTFVTDFFYHVETGNIIGQLFPSVAIMLVLIALVVCTFPSKPVQQTHTK